MLHINIFGVVTCSYDSTRRLFTCNIASFFNSFHYNITQFHCCNVSIAIQEKKLKLNKMLSILVMSCNFMSCNFMSCIFTCCIFMPYNLVRHFHVRNFQRPLRRSLPAAGWRSFHSQTRSLRYGGHCSTHSDYSYMCLVQNQSRQQHVLSHHQTTHQTCPHGNLVHLFGRSKEKKTADTRHRKTSKE